MGPPEAESISIASFRVSLPVWIYTEYGLPVRVVLGREMIEMEEKGNKKLLVHNFFFQSACNAPEIFSWLEIMGDPVFSARSSSRRSSSSVFPYEKIFPL